MWAPHKDMSKKEHLREVDYRWMIGLGVEVVLGFDNPSN
jgi:hypothetical protein